MKIHHVALTVNDLNESKSFYENIFGFKEVKNFERKDLQAKAVFMELDGFKLELWSFSTEIVNIDNLSDLKVRGLRHVAFEVQDLDTRVIELRQKGVVLSDPQLGASGHRYCFLSDPNGIALELFEV